MYHCGELSSGPAIPRAHFSQGPTFSALLMCLHNLWEMKEWLAEELLAKMETLLLLILLLLFAPSRNLHHPGNYFSPFCSWLSWDTWVRGGLPRSSFSLSILKIFLDFLLNLIFSTFQDSQFESHLFDECFCLFWNWTWKYCLLYQRQFLFKDTFRIILQINLCLLVSENCPINIFLIASSKCVTKVSPPYRHQSLKGARYLPLLLGDFCFALSLMAEFYVKLVNMWNSFGNRQNRTPW